MSGNSKLFEKYKRSDIFNINDDEEFIKTERKPRTRNVQSSFKNTQNDVFHTFELNSRSNLNKPIPKKNICF